MIKKCIIMIIISMFIISGIIYADNNKLNSVNNQINDIRNQINDKKEELSSLSSDILRLDIEIAEIESKINSLNVELSITQNKIDITTNKIIEKEQDIDNLTIALSNRIRTMSKINEFDYIQIMFSSKSLSDFLSNYTIIKKIIQQDKDNLKKLEIAKQELTITKEELNIMKKSLQDMQVEYNRKNNDLKSARKIQEENVNKLNSDIVSLRQIEDKKVQEARQLEEEIKKLSAKNNYQGSYSGGKFIYPVAGGSITSYYGYRNHPILKTNLFHTGIDIAGSTGTPILSAESGKVIYAGPRSTYGNIVMIDHGSNIVTLYAHCNTVNVTVGQLVSRGQTIATVGSTGRSTGPHLHFEVRINGAFTDPLPYIR